MDKKSKKAVMTAENFDEAKALRDLWTSREHPTQVVFGEKYGIGNQSAVGQFLRGIVPISLKAARGFAEGLQCQIADFSPRLAAEIEALAKHTTDTSEDDFAEVRLLDVKASAGHGSIPHLGEDLGIIKFRRDFLRSVGVSEANAVVITVKGASMEPTIADGAALLVNRANREPRTNSIYVFHAQGNGLVVKRVVRVGEQWIARSDNDDRSMYPDFPFADGATLIGRAVWMGTKLWSSHDPK